MSNGKDIRKAQKAIKAGKPFVDPYKYDIDYMSKMGYRDDSPYNQNPYNDIYTPNGMIDMSQTGIPLYANGQYLPPYSGMHNLGTTNVREVPANKLLKAQDGYENDTDPIAHLKWGKYIDDPKRREQHIIDVYQYLMDSKWDPKSIVDFMKKNGAYGSKNRGNIAKKGADWGWDSEDINNEVLGKAWDDYYNNRTVYDKKEYGGWLDTYGDGAEKRKIPQSGIVVDKRTNIGYAMGDDGKTRTFNVLTGQVVDVNKDYSYDQVAKNPKLRGTPVGYYLLQKELTKIKGDDDDKHYKNKIRYLKPISAFGEKVNSSSDLAFHRLYSDNAYDPNDKEFNRRKALLNQSDANKRCASWGCTNVDDYTYDNVNKMFSKADTLMVIDSKRPKDLALLNQTKKRMKASLDQDPSLAVGYKKMGGWLDDYQVGGLKSVTGPAPKFDAKTEAKGKRIASGYNNANKQNAEISQTRNWSQADQDHSNMVKARINNPASDLGILGANMASNITRFRNLTPEEIARVTDNPGETINLSSEMLKDGLINELVGYGATKAIPFLSKSAKSAGKYLTEQTALKNAYKLNPYAFKPNPESYYRMVGKEGIKDATESGIIRANQKIPLADNGEPFGDLTTPEFEDAYFSKSRPFDGREYGKTPWYGKYEGPGMIEVKNKDYFKPLSKHIDYIGLPKSTIKTSDEAIKFYKEHWLQGYKEVPKELPGSSNKINTKKMWRIENPNIKFNPSKVANENAQQEHVGNWFSDDINYVSDYLRKNQKVPGSRLAEVNVPESELSKYHISNYPDMKDVELRNWLIPDAFNRNYTDLSHLPISGGNLSKIKENQNYIKELVNKKIAEKKYGGWLDNLDTYQTAGQVNNRQDNTRVVIPNLPKDVFNEKNSFKKDWLSDAYEEDENVKLLKKQLAKDYQKNGLSKDQAKLLAEDAYRNVKHNKSLKETIPESTFEQHVPQDLTSKTLEVLANPLLAMKQYKGHRLPDHFSSADEDFMSPVNISNLGYQFLTGPGQLAFSSEKGNEAIDNIKEGDYLQAGLNAAFAIPGVKVIKDAIKYKNKLNRVANIKEIRKVSNYLNKEGALENQAINELDQQYANRLELENDIPPPPTYEQYAEAQIDPLSRQDYINLERSNPETLDAINRIRNSQRQNYEMYNDLYDQSYSSAPVNRLPDIWTNYRKRQSLTQDLMNRSGVTKEQALERFNLKDKDLLSKMSAKDFKETVVKPTGDLAEYIPEPSIKQMTYKSELGDKQLKDAILMSKEEYSTAFNDRLDLLNNIIKKNNKTGIEYRVKELDPAGNLRFETPEQFILDSNKPVDKTLLEALNKIDEPAFLYKGDNNKLYFSNMSGTPGFTTKEEAKNWITAMVESQSRNRIPKHESTWHTDINPGNWRGDVEDIANTEYYKSIPGLNMRNTSSLFGYGTPKRGSGTYQSINEYLKALDLGRVKAGFNSQTDNSFGLWNNAVKKGNAVGFYRTPDLVHGVMKSALPYIGTGALGAAALDQEKLGGQRRLKKATSKNIQSSINDLMLRSDLMQRNQTLFGPAGKRRYKPGLKYEQGGWLDQFDK